MNRLKRMNIGRDGHWYKLDGEYAPGVTTVLGGGLAVPFGIPSSWAARLVAEFVAEHRDWLIQAPDPRFIIEGLKAIPRNNTADAALKGSTIHAYADRLKHGDPVELEPGHDEWFPHVQACATFLDDWHIDVYAAEIPLALTQLRVCGTTDLIARSPAIVEHVNRMRLEADLPALPDDALGVLDYKSGKALRDKDRVQVETYRRADLAHIDGVEQPMPALHWSGLVHVTGDGCRLELVHPAYHDPLFRLFRAALFEWQALDEKRGWIGLASRPAEELAPTAEGNAA
jgi:hypothetical protein